MSGALSTPPWVAAQRETHLRSLTKAVSWRVWGTVATSTLVFLFTGRWALSLMVGALEFVSKIGLFWAHERAWERVGIGRAAVLPPDAPPRPAVVWLTGLSGAGKSTIAALVAAELRGRGLPVEELDGDAVRAVFPSTGFGRAERDAHVRRVGFVASRLERNGVFVVASLVSPYAESRDFVRGLCANFVEVHVATPLDECERRDVKGLYARARRGELRQFTGIDDPYEPPAAPELSIDTRGRSAAEAAALVVAHLTSAPAAAPPAAVPAPSPVQRQPQVEHGSPHAA